MHLLRDEPSKVLGGVDVEGGTAQAGTLHPAADGACPWGRGYLVKDNGHLLGALFHVRGFGGLGAEGEIVINWSGLVVFSCHSLVLCVRVRVLGEGFQGGGVA